MTFQWTPGIEGLTVITKLSILDVNWGHGSTSELLYTSVQSMDENMDAFLFI